MEKYYRIIIDLYQKSFTDYINNQPIDVDAISEAQRCINYAIDRAKINNDPYDELENLKSDLNRLKYDLL